MVGRLRPDITVQSAQRELDALAQHDVAEAAPATTQLLRPSTMVGFRDSLIMLAVAVILVLLIACANVAQLFLARGATRGRELAIRASLGAGGARLFRQLLVESLMLSVAGCLGGLALGWACVRLLVATRPDSLTELGAAHLDLRVMTAMIVLAVATGVFFGIVGLWQAARHSAHESLKSGALFASANRAQRRFSGMLIVTQMAIAASLLVGATLLVRSVSRLQHLNVGFQPAGLYSMDVVLPQAGYSTAGARQLMLDQMITRVRAIPGVQAVSAAKSAPPTMRGVLFGTIEAEGSTLRSDVQSIVPTNTIGPEFFRVTGLPLVEGTTFTDTTEAAGQVIINHALAHQYWPTASAIGRRIRFSAQSPWKTVVGDAATTGLLGDQHDPVAYLTGPTADRQTLLIRVAPSTNPMPAVRSAVAALDSRLPVPALANVADEMGKAVVRPRFIMTLLTMFTLLALALSAVGLYGIMAHGVAQRTREIGIRIAVGATRRSVVQAVIVRSLLYAVSGAAIGLVAARWTTTLVGSLLYGLPRNDPASFAAGALVLLVTAIMASVVPAHRAISVDPVIALRAD